MKKRSLLPGFALAALLALGFAGTAQATSYSSCSDYNNNTPPPSGDITITNTGACSLNAVSTSNAFTVNSTGAITASSISAAGEVHLQGTTVTASGTVESTGNQLYIKATSGDVNTKAITAHGGYIQVLAPSGKITVDGNVSGTNLTQIFSANSNISLKNVDNSNGDVRIFANKGTGPTSTTFNVGDGSTNGATYIHNNGSIGYQIYISNGTGSGGITVSSDTGLQVTASAGPTGGVILDGGANGTVTLNKSISVDGAGGYGSGGISILAPEIVAAGSTLSANAPGHQVGQINLITNKITNNTGGLTISINGDGPFPDYVDLTITPVGSWSITAPESPASSISFGDFTSSSNSLQITGTGEFIVNANGNNNGLKIWGYPLTIDSASASISQQGGGNGVSIESWDGATETNTNTLTLGTLSVYENTTASGQDRNLIKMSASEIASLSGNVILDAQVLMTVMEATLLSRLLPEQ